MKHLKYFQLTLMVVLMLFTWSCNKEDSLPPLVSIDEYFTLNKVEGYTTTESGLRYKVVTLGNEDSVKSYDVVKVHLVMTTLKDAKVFDNSFTTSLDEFANLTSGMLETVGLVSEKGKISAYLPSKLAFGGQGWNNQIRPNEDINITVTLDSIKMSIPQYIIDNELEGMIKTTSGLYYKIVESGVGVVAKSGQTVSVDYTGAFLDGDIFDTSLSKAPFKFVLGAKTVIAGWDEGIALLKKGDKAIFLVPYTLAYGVSGYSVIPPYEPLRFDITLLDIK